MRLLPSVLFIFSLYCFSTTIEGFEHPDTVSSRLLQLDYCSGVRNLTKYLEAFDNHSNSGVMVCSNAGLSGKFQDDFTETYSYLTHIDLSDNHISDSFPRNLERLTEITHLDLSENWVNRAVNTSQLFQLTSLEYLDLGIDEYRYISPSENVPSIIKTLTNLKHLGLKNVGIAGVYPKELSEMNQLTHLNIRKAQFRGALTDLSKLTNLEFLDISLLRYVNRVPDIVKLTNLKHLAVGLLRDSTPDIQTIFKLTKLTFLDTSSSSFARPIPGTVANMLNLVHWRSNFAGFTGQIASSLWKLRTLERIDMSQNKFTSSIPSEIAALDSLWDLDISEAGLYGTLPTEIGKMSNLKSLNLYSNSLYGTLPTDIGLLSSLTDLAIFGNFFQGTFPTEIGLLTRLQYLSLYNNCFNGSFPTEIKNLQHLEILYIENNRFEGTVPTLPFGVYLSDEKTGANYSKFNENCKPHVTGPKTKKDNGRNGIAALVSGIVIPVVLLFAVICTLTIRIKNKEKRTSFEASIIEEKPKRTSKSVNPVAEDISHSDTVFQGIGFEKQLESKTSPVQKRI